MNLNRRGWLLGALMTPLVWLFRGYECKPLATQKQKDLIWSTYGKGVMDGYQIGHIKSLPVVKCKRLEDCDTDHLMAILRTQPIIPVYKTAIRNILVDRGISRRKIENLV